MKVTVPDSWSEVTVGQYQELMNTDREHEVLSILLNEDPEVVRTFDSEAMAKIINHVEWVKRLPSEATYKAFIEIDGVEYRLIENLNLFSLGEWMDMEEYLSDFNKNIHLILAMLYRENKAYTYEDCKKRSELFQDKLMIGDVYGSFVFFSIVASQSLISIPHYSIIQNLTQTKRQPKGVKGWLMRRLQRNGVGTPMLTH